MFSYSPYFSSFTYNFFSIFEFLNVLGKNILVLVENGNFKWQNSHIYDSPNVNKGVDSAQISNH